MKNDNKEYHVPREVGEALIEKGLATVGMSKQDYSAIEDAFGKRAERFEFLASLCRQNFKGLCRVLAGKEIEGPDGKPFTLTSDEKAHIHNQMKELLPADLVAEIARKGAN